MHRGRRKRRSGSEPQQADYEQPRGRRPESVLQSGRRDEVESTEVLEVRGRPGLRRLYSALFTLGVGSLLGAVCLGIYQSIRTDGRPPGISLDYTRPMKQKLMQDDFLDAIPQLEMAIALDHANEHVALSFMGSALARQGKTDEAIDCFRRSIAFQPGYADAHFGLAMSLAVRHEYAEAIQQFRRTLELRPSHPQARKYLELAIQQSNSAAAPGKD